MLCSPQQVPDMNKGKRILLMLAYAVISFITCFFFLGIGHGPFQPLSIMESWGMVVLHLLFRSAPIGIGVALLFVATFFLYPLFILMLNNILRRIVRMPVPIVTLAIHAAGTWAGLITIGKQGHEVSPGFNLLAWIVPIPIVIIYLIIEWRLATARKKPAPITP